MTQKARQKLQTARVEASRGNTAKYLSYKEAWRRISEANEAGFYFEVVTLCESIISDRLLSFVHGERPERNATVRTPFHKLIEAWRDATTGALPDFKGRDLGDATNRWREDRNAIVHGLAKSMPTVPTEPVQTFLERARATAEAGMELARAVSNWHKKELAKKRQLKSRVSPGTRAAGVGIRADARRRRAR